MKNKLFLVPCFFMVRAEDETSAVTKVGDYGMEWEVKDGIHFLLDESLPTVEVKDTGEFPHTMKDLIKRTPFTLEDFHKGNQVNVKRMEGDQFNHDFTGRVLAVTKEHVIVEDQDGDCWSCEPSQLSFSSDEIMHEDA